MPDLPDRLAAKIAYGPSCWTWTGYVIPLRETTRLAFRRDNGWTGRPRVDVPRPRVHHDGASRPVARVVMAYYLGVPYRAVPQMRRDCSNPLCVNPHHHTIIGKGPIKPKLADWSPDEAIPEPPSDLLAALIEAETMPDIGPEAAAVELGVSHIPPHVWAQYLETLT